MCLIPVFIGLWSLKQSFPKKANQPSERSHYDLPAPLSHGRNSAGKFEVPGLLMVLLTSFQSLISHYMSQRGTGSMVAEHRE